MGWHETRTAMDAMSTPDGTETAAQGANDGAAPSLDRSLVSGLAWTASFKWIGQFVSWVATLYAARQLAPGDYGLVSMAMLGIGLARMVQDFGLDSILVQDRSIEGERQARLGGLILLLGFALWALFALLAAPMALFFKEPQVTALVLVVASVFVTDALQVIPRAQMQRALRYDQLAWTNFVQLLATQLALVAAVRADWGHWAIIASTIAGEVVVTVVLWRVSPFALAWPRELRALRATLLSGWRIMGSRAAWFGYTNADQAIIGRVIGKDGLGVYSFATTFSSLPQAEVGAIVSRVVPGIFSLVQDRPDVLRRYFLRLTEFLTVLSFPMSVGIALVADLVMPLVLGPQWSEVITPMRLLCAYAVFQTAQSMVSHVLMWTGQFRVHMWCSILAGVMMPIAVAIGASLDGLRGVGWAWVLIYPIANLPSFFYAFRTARMTMWDWFGSLAPATVGCVGMALAVIGVRLAIPATLSPWVQSGLVMGVGAVAYAATLWLIFPARIAAALSTVQSLRAGQTGALLR